MALPVKKLQSPGSKFFIGLSNINLPQHIIITFYLNRSTKLKESTTRQTTKIGSTVASQGVRVGEVSEHLTNQEFHSPTNTFNTFSDEYVAPGMLSAVYLASVVFRLLR